MICTDYHIASGAPTARRTVRCAADMDQQPLGDGEDRLPLAVAPGHWINHAAVLAQRAAEMPDWRHAVIAQAPSPATMLSPAELTITAAGTATILIQMLPPWCHVRVDGPVPTSIDLPDGDSSLEIVVELPGDYAITARAARHSTTQWVCHVSD